MESTQPKTFDFLSLIKEINTFCDNHIYHINNGGCGHFAFIITNELKTKKIPFKIHIFSKIGFCNFKEIKRNFVTTFAKEFKFDHIIIEAESIFFDGKRFYTSKEDVLHQMSFYTGHDFEYNGEITANELKYLLKYAPWKSAYDPVTQNRRLRKKVKEKFNNFDYKLKRDY